MKHFITISALLILAQICFGQKLTSFEIEQVTLPGGYFSKYQFDGEKLIVTENSKRKKIINLDQREINQLDSVLNAVRIDTLKDSYSRPVMDGINHTFLFEYAGKKKVVKLWNYYLENLDRFLIAVNDLLREKYQIISLGQDMLAQPDTVIYYLPDFYVDTFDIPDQYDSYRVMCFRKGYFITDILDSINLCDCRIYPTDKNGVYKKRHYWRAFRLEGNSWRREYFDNQSQSFRTEYIKDIFPYEIVSEKTHTDIGTKPSVEIYKYYKTHIVEK